MNVVFKSKNFVAVDKEAGWLSVPSRDGKDDRRPCVKFELERLLGKRAWSVHRLDQEVSGLLLFALDAESHRRASGWFESRTVKKLYEALTEGTPPPRDNAGEACEWHSTLVRGKRRAYEAPHGKPAVTRALFLGKEPMHGFLKWQLEPLTGRAHQLRYELAKHGCPIVGDRLYGSSQDYEKGGIGLRAIQLDFSACDGAQDLGLPPHIQL